MKITIILKEGKNMKKRGFIAAIGSIALLLSGCGSGSSVAKYKAGEYTATAAGRNGDVTLHVTFTSDKIEKITTENQETKGIGADAIDTLIQKTIDDQAVPADMVSGATISSTAYITALKDAIAQAGGTASTASASAESNDYSTTDADVIVVGGGAAGMTASVTLADQGYSVILLEKSDKLGGNTPAAANGINAADSQVQLNDQQYKDAGASVEGLENLQSQNPEARKNLVDAFAENSGSVIDWMSNDLGVSVKVDIQEDSRNTVQNYYMLQADADGSTGITLTNAMETALAKRDVTVYKNTDATSLITDEDGKVTGVKADCDDDQEREFTGKAVLLATGGFGHNQELLAKINPKLANATTDEIAPTTGEGLLMAEAVGAKTVDLDAIQTFPVVITGYGMCTPNKLPGGMSLDGAIIVNDNAERFTAEQFEAGDAILQQPNGNAYMIFGENDLNDDMKQIMSAGYVQEADSLSELGEKLGIDGDTLAKTVSAYNDDIADGTDDAYGRQNPTAVDTSGKFYGFKYGVGAHYFMGGILIDENTHVLNEDEQPIEGLYAAGEVTGGFHGTQRIDGSGIGDSFIFGRIAGNSIGEALK
jgi:flavocytochrome c